MSCSSGCKKPVCFACNVDTPKVEKQESDLTGSYVEDFFFLPMLVVLLEVDK